MSVSYTSHHQVFVCNTTKRSLILLLSEPILEFNLEFLQLIEEATLILILKSHSCIVMLLFSNRSQLSLSCISWIFQKGQYIKNTIMANRTKEKPCDRRSKFATVDGDGDGDPVACCSGKHCKSCTGGYIADCVAICCCPCVVLHCFAMAFVKVPYVVGRRCLGLEKKKKKNKEKGKMVHDVEVERNMESLRVEHSSTNIVACDSVGLEAEVWNELNQIGYLGFGRVSNPE